MRGPINQGWGSGEPSITEQEHTTTFLLISRLLFSICSVLPIIPHIHSLYREMMVFTISLIIACHTQAVCYATKVKFSYLPHQKALSESDPQNPRVDTP